ncbi:MAG TPA: Na+/H+ antiporter subunit E [Sandaracinaceae bacterium]
MIRLLAAIVTAWAAELASATAAAARGASALARGEWRARLVPAFAVALVVLAGTGVRSAGNLALALLVGLALAPLVPRTHVRTRGLTALARAGALLVMIVAWAGALARGALGVWPVLLGLRSARHGGLLSVELEAASDAGAILTGLVATSTPGTVVVELDEAGRQLVVHALDARRADALRRSLARFYARYQRRVVP